MYNQGVAGIGRRNHVRNNANTLMRKAGVSFNTRTLYNSTMVPLGAENDF